ncbi:MAG: YeeE/YedE family protein [Rhizobiaceae bacterium]|nr:YeeE/YedE family protein [Rhizobiaceae bacterium]
MITEFTPYMSLGGGILIGLAATLLMAFNGRIAGMTGILGGILPPVSSDWPWRAAFLAGAIIAPMIYVMSGNTIGFSVPISTGALVIGGLIVGVGVMFGSGCTSGHGVCGMARLSPRSIAATLVFMVSTGITVFVVRHIIGGI